MDDFPDNLYDRWRSGIVSCNGFQEEEGTPHEALLQRIWQYQRIYRDELRVNDGRRIRVWHPGFWNRGPGPDFQQALIGFDDEPPVAGDVEVDVHRSGWREHRHEGNPNYCGVILRVVWQAAPVDHRFPPVLALDSCIDSSIPSLKEELRKVDDSLLPGRLAGVCSPLLRDLGPKTWRVILRQAARIRLQIKAARFHARARQAGWEQALWEGLFRALGYQQNTWPMHCLAERVPQLTRPEDSLNGMQARLLGVSGLLPADLTRSGPAALRYARLLWDEWWRERESLESFILPRKLWRFQALRPANHPQRRLALAAHWLLRPNFFTALEDWISRRLDDRELQPTLLSVLQGSRDPFWSWHWTIHSRRMSTPQPLLGTSRVNDLVMNAILPWLWIRAVSGQNQCLRQIAEHRYFAWPLGQDNRILRRARQRLFGNVPRHTFGTGAAEQGLLQVARDFCDNANAICEHCPFPKLLAEFIRARRNKLVG